MSTDYTRTAVPAWYEITRKDYSTLRLNVHRTAFSFMQSADWGKAPGVEAYQKQFGFVSFTPPQMGDCGFENILKLGHSSHPEWVTWEFILPAIHRIGQKQKPNREAAAIRATLFMFVSISLGLFKGDTRWKEPQLMIYNGISLPTGDHSYNSGALHVILTPAVSAWLNSRKDDLFLRTISNAMRLAYEYMWDGRAMEEFRVFLSGKRHLTLEIPSSKCCRLHPDSIRDGDEARGYALVPNNIDYAVEQLTFLAGLPCLHDLVRDRNVDDD